jgi:putative FmdB family regulatory protein
VPVYDYVCEACRHRFEAFHGLNEHGPSQCSACGGGPVKRAFAPPTIVFKGSGWAKLDRRYSGSPQRRKGEDTGTGSGTKAEGEAGAPPKAEGEGGAPPKPEGRSGAESAKSEGSATPPAE